VSLCEKCGDTLTRPGRFCGYCLPCRECNGWHHVGTPCVTPRKESPVAADFCDLIADLQKRLASALQRAEAAETPDPQERIVADDEIVCRGDFHMERMADGHIWFVVEVRGERRAFDLTSRGRISWQEQDGWQPFRAARPAPTPGGTG
jgi:hypothetical protein